jgi:hypothetical protein
MCIDRSHIVVWTARSNNLSESKPSKTAKARRNTLQIWGLGCEWRGGKLAGEHLLSSSAVGHCLLGDKKTFKLVVVEPNA